jgi:hypothetical protein
MNWTNPDDLRAQLLKLWNKGDILSSLVTGESLFPRRLTLKSPTSDEMAAHFDETRGWGAALRSLPHCRVEMREFRHRLLGSNAIPSEAWIDSLDAAIAWLGKKKDVSRFAALLEMTRQCQPILLDWLAKKPMKALDLEGEWAHLLAIVAWIQAHPRSGLYLRQVDLPGIHSKFIEAHRGVLAELLDLALPPEAIDPSAAGVSQFARRYGFRDKPLLVRFRMLNSEADMALDAVSFARLNPGVSQVFMTENEINYLAFPPRPDSLIIFGAGYGFETLIQVEWLLRCRVYYWGDIDTHGFAILDQLRSQLPHAESFLMDRATLLAFEPQWGEEDKPSLRDLTRLTAEERALYDDLRDNRIRAKLRLEQEKIGYGWLESALSQI